MLNRDVWRYLIEFVDLKDRLNLRRVCIEFRDVIDHTTIHVYTFLEEMQRKRIAKSIYRLLLSDSDTNHFMYLEQLKTVHRQYYIEDETKNWKQCRKYKNGSPVLYWDRPLRLPTGKEFDKIRHQEICSWLLLFDDWICSRFENKIFYDREFFAFWGYSEENYLMMEEAATGIRNDHTVIQSYLPKWVMEELYPKTEL